MFNFGGTKLTNLISAFGDFKIKTKKHVQSQTKAFGSLHEWALDANNAAIQDVTNKLDTLFCKIDFDLNKDKLDSLKEVTSMFKKFKEYDSKLTKLYQNSKIAERIEKRCLNEMTKCPSTKNIKDYEIRYKKAKQEREKAELRYYEYSQEIEATKSILFKTQMKRFNETLLRQNEAENVLLSAMSSLIDKIPDVSNEEVDDIGVINYKNQAQTAEICSEAKKKLSRLSSSAYGVRLENVNNVLNSDSTPHLDNEIPKEIECKINVADREMNDENIVTDNYESELYKEESQFTNSTKTEPAIPKRPKTRISCPPKFALSKIEEAVQSEKLYPYLPGNEPYLYELPPIPPPTYSDSESFYSNTFTKKADKRRSVEPSAPVYSK